MIPAWLIAASDSIKQDYRQDALIFQLAFKKALEERGIAVKMEIPVKSREAHTDRRGRIDIKALEPSGQSYFIELDKDKPRQKSIYKLRHNGGGYVVCRKHPCIWVIPPTEELPVLTV